MISHSLFFFALTSLTPSTFALPSYLGMMDANDPSGTSSGPDPLTSWVSDPLVCGLYGYTETDHNNLISPVLGPETLEACRNACTAYTGTPACQSVGWYNAGVCYIFSEPMQCNHLLEDDSSMFAYYDRNCPTERNLVVGGGTEE